MDKDTVLFHLAQKHSATIRALSDEEVARLYRSNRGKLMGELLLREALYRGTERNYQAGGYEPAEKVTKR